MQIRRATLEDCAAADDLVVVIDVIRAFTTAAFAFAAGARDILPVGTVEEAFQLRERLPDALLMGEVGGLPPPGFDFGNSPAALLGHNFAGQRLIQRTGAGTQGIVRSRRAQTLIASSFVCAAATVQYIHRQAPETVTLVATGFAPEGAEDVACADYLEALLLGHNPEPIAFLERVRDSYAGKLRPDRLWPEHAEDMECCTALDRFDFTMLIQRHNDLLVMEQVE